MGVRCIFGLTVVATIMASQPPQAEACAPAAVGLIALEVVGEADDLHVEVSAELLHGGAGWVDLTISGVVPRTVRSEFAFGPEYHSTFIPLTADETAHILRGRSLHLSAHILLADAAGNGHPKSGYVVFEHTVGGKALPATSPGPDRLLFFLLVLAVLAIGAIYRREDMIVDRVRLAGAAGLVAVLFVCTSFAMPWAQSQAHDGARGVCALSDAADCIAPLLSLDPETKAASDQVQLTAFATAGIRAGQVALIMMLIPAFIWLLVAPTSRAAVSLVAGGAFPAMLLASSTTCFYLALSGNSVRRAGAADLNLFAAVVIVVVAFLTLRSTVQLRRDGADVPTAIARDRD